MWRRADRDSWPKWLEPLRPDELTRTRLARAIQAEAEGIFRARRGRWLDVASGWFGTLAPVAAVLAIAFAGLAYSASRPVSVTDAPATFEELFDEDLEGPPSFLIATTEPDADNVLTAVIEYPNP